MDTSAREGHVLLLHPVHAVLVAATLPLFLGALLCDLRYNSTYLAQWTNFSSWLIAGGLVFAGLALLWAVVEFFRADARWRGRALLYLLLLLGTFILGFINALEHAKDAWGAMPEGLILSILVTVLCFATLWVGFSSPRKALT